MDPYSSDDIFHPTTTIPQRRRLEGGSSGLKMSLRLRPIDYSSFDGDDDDGDDYYSSSSGGSKEDDYTTTTTDDDEKDDDDNDDDEQSSSHGSIDFATFNIKQKFGEEDVSNKDVIDPTTKSTSAFERFGVISGVKTTTTTTTTTEKDPSPNSVIHHYHHHHDVDNSGRGRFRSRVKLPKQNIVFGRVVVGESTIPSKDESLSSSSSLREKENHVHHQQQQRQSGGGSSTTTTTHSPRPPMKSWVGGGVSLLAGTTTTTTMIDGDTTDPSSTFVEHDEETSPSEMFREAHHLRQQKNQTDKDDIMNELKEEVDTRTSWRKEKAPEEEGKWMMTVNSEDEKMKNGGTNGHDNNNNPSNIFSIQEAMNQRLAVDDELYRIGSEYEKESLTSHHRVGDGGDKEKMSKMSSSLSHDGNESSITDLRQEALGWNYGDVRSELTTASSAVNKKTEPKQPSSLTPSKPFKTRTNSSDKRKASDKQTHRDLNLSSNVTSVKEEEPGEEETSIESRRVKGVPLSVSTEGEDSKRRHPSTREVRQKVAKKMDQMNRRSSHGSAATKTTELTTDSSSSGRSPNTTTSTTSMKLPPRASKLPPRAASEKVGRKNKEAPALSFPKPATSESQLPKTVAADRVVAKDDKQQSSRPSEASSGVFPSPTTGDSEKKKAKGKKHKHGRRQPKDGEQYYKRHEGDDADADADVEEVGERRRRKEHRRDKEDGGDGYTTGDEDQHRRKKKDRSRSKGSKAGKTSPASSGRHYVVGLNDLMGSEISTPDPGEEKMEESEVMELERRRSDRSSLCSTGGESRDKFHSTKKLRRSKSARRAFELAVKRDRATKKGPGPGGSGAFDRLRFWGGKTSVRVRDDSFNDLITGEGSTKQKRQTGSQKKKNTDHKHFGLQMQKFFGPQCWRYKCHIAIGIILFILMFSISIRLATRGDGDDEPPAPSRPAIYFPFQNITGTFENDSAGTAVSLSEDGRILAVGYSIEGVVRVFKRDADGLRFLQVGRDLDSSQPGDLFGAAVAISGDGTRLVVGARDNDNGGDQRGEARVYSFGDSGVWTQLGSTISGLERGGTSGFSVDFAANGNRIVVGSPRAGKSGSATVYELIGEQTWTLVGETLVGRGDDERFGYDVSLNDDGTRLAVSAIRATVDSEELRGRVQVFDFRGSGTFGTWDPVGNDIVGVSLGDLHGQSVELDSTGSRIAVGANGHDNSVNGTSNVGACTVYDYAGAEWTQVGDVMEGELRGEQSGISLAMSSDGNVIACGGAKSPVNGDDSGVVRAYRLQGGTWEQIGEDLVGGEGVAFGSSVAVSADSKFLAVGAPESSISFLVDVGVVHLFALL